jgi:hypothetical protein
LKTSLLDSCASENLAPPSGRVSEPARFSSASEGGRRGMGSRDCASNSKKIVQLFTNALEWRCLDRIRAPIQELCVTNLPE